VQKLNYLPEAHTDFIFSVIGEELGFLGVCAIIGLYALLVGRALYVGYRCVGRNRHFAGYIAFGIALWIGMQAFVSIGVNLGLLPTKGLTLPLISSGGSSVLMTCAAMGLLLRVSYELSRAEKHIALTRGETVVVADPKTPASKPARDAEPEAPAPAKAAARGNARPQRIEPTFERIG
jgi:cell division protein FtsW